MALTDRDMRKLSNTKQGSMEFLGKPSIHGMLDGQIAIERQSNSHLALYRKQYGKLWKSYMSHDGNQYVDKNLTIKNNLVVGGNVQIDNSVTIGVAVTVTDDTASSATQGGFLRLASNDGAVMASGHRLGVLEFAGAEDTSSTITVGARIEALADATWSDSENGADMVFYTTDGNASQSEVMRLTADAGVLFSNTVTTGVDDTGVDVRVYSATTNEGLLYDSSEDELGLLLTTKLKFHDIGGGEEMYASGDGVLLLNSGTSLTITTPTLDLTSTTKVDFDSPILDMATQGTTIELKRQVDALAFDGASDNILNIDATNNRVGIGTAAPGAMLDVTSAASTAQIHLNSAANNNASIIYQEAGTQVWEVFADISGDDKFYIRDAGSDDGMYLAQGAADWADASDERLKTSLSPIENAVDKLNTLQAINFKWKYGSEKRRARNNIGLIAQEVQKIAPEAVDIPDEDFEIVSHPIFEGEKQAKGYLGLSYSRLIPILVKAVQELSVEVDILKNK